MSGAKDSGSERETWSRRKLLATMGTAAAGLVLGAAGAELVAPRTASAAGVLPTPPPTPEWLNVKSFGAQGLGRYDQNDTPYIQAAINAIGPYGGVVYFPQGQYILDGGIHLRNNVQLVGDGSGVSVLKSIRSRMPLIHGSKVKNARVEGLSLEGSSSLSGEKSDTIEKGIDLKDCEHVWIRDIGFKLITNGVWISDCTQVTVADCAFELILSSDNSYEGHGIYVQSGSGHSIQNNRFQDLEKACIYMAGGCSHSVIAGNTADSCKDSLVTLSSSVKPCSFHRIEGNKTTSNGKTECKQGIVLRNYCTNNIILNNWITAMTAEGIALVSDGGDVDERPSGNRIAGNRIDGAGKGIVLTNSTANTIAGNEIRRADIGIELDTAGENEGSRSSDNVITGNTVFRCSKAGIRIGTVRCEGNAVYGNGGAGNGEALEDKGTDTIRNGF